MNVVVSALIWGDTPYKLLQAATAGEVELFTAPVLLADPIAQGPTLWAATRVKPILPAAAAGRKVECGLDATMQGRNRAKSGTPAG